MNYIVPALFIITFIIAVIRKVNIFESFTEGAKEAIKLMLTLLPYLIAIFMAVELMRASGLSHYLAVGLAPIFKLVGVPVELAELLILRPLSGSGSLVVLETIFSQYGVDSYISRVASVIMGGTDTILYIVAVYFSTCKDKKTGLAIPISLATAIFGAIFSALLCKWM